MKLLYVLIGAFIVACTSPRPTREPDLIDKLIRVHQTGETATLLALLGTPTRIESTGEPNLQKYVYERGPSQPYAFESSVNPSRGEVITSSTFFWRSEDDYGLLKERFGKFRWQEKSIKTSPHPPRELYEVEIPELGLSFEYDRLAPKIMWLIFSKPKRE